MQFLSYQLHITTPFSKAFVHNNGPISHVYKGSACISRVQKCSNKHQRGENHLHSFRLLQWQCAFKKNDTTFLYYSGWTGGGRKLNAGADLDAKEINERITYWKIPSTSAHTIQRICFFLSSAVWLVVVVRTSGSWNSSELGLAANSCGIFPHVLRSQGENSCVNKRHLVGEAYSNELVNLSSRSLLSPSVLSLAWTAKKVWLGMSIATLEWKFLSPYSTTASQCHKIDRKGRRGIER